MNGTCVILLVLTPPLKHLWEVNGNCSHSRLPRLLHPVSSSSERFVMYMDKKKIRFHLPKGFIKHLPTVTVQIFSV